MRDKLLPFWNSKRERCGIILSCGSVVEIYNCANEFGMTANCEFAMHNDAVFNAVPPGSHLKGVFHTHPSGIDRPSSMDIAGWPVGVEYYIVTQTTVTEWKLVGSRAILVSRLGAEPPMADSVHRASASS